MNPAVTRKLPREYVAKKFFELCYRAHYNRSNDTYNGCCPLCNEGKSFGKKKRCWYLPSKDLVYCFNCGWSSRPIKWITEASGMSYYDIMREVGDGEYNFINLDRVQTYKELDLSALVPEGFNEGLPDDAINLLNPLQLEYYKGNSTVLNAMRYLKRRRLLSAINRPKAYYLSLTDPVHRNRIIIPFFDKDGSIPFYQSRAFGGNVDGYAEDIRYLSKKGSERSIFGIDKISDEIDYIFLFEGPVDSCFIRNGVGIAGINLSINRDFTPKQEEQLRAYQFTHKFIWILDSQWCDKTAKQKTELLLNSGESVFIWPKELGYEFKDINECCIAREMDEFPVDYITERTVTGQLGLLQFRMGQAQEQR